MKLRKLIPAPARRLLWVAWESSVSRWHKWLAERRLRAPRAGRPHDLPGELIVSVTSYPARFDSLHLTLGCLLDQTVRPDRVVLWISECDLGVIPAPVHALQRSGLEIRPCAEMRSFKKLVPALEAFPTSYIATADDDISYPPDWLERLVEGVEYAVPTIVGHRAVRLKWDSPEQLAPFESWALDVQDNEARSPSSNIMTEGAGGTLYPPYSLDDMVKNRALFERLCPEGDDLWFYWCARRAGTLYKKVGSTISLIPWSGSQVTSLWEKNRAGGNDAMIRALSDELGALPPPQRRTVC